MGVVGRLDQYASMLATEFDETTANGPTITGLGTYYASEFSENVGIATTMTANIFPPYDLVYDEFGGTLFGAGQGRYMRQNTDKSVIVYNEIDEIGLMPSYVISPSTTSVNEGSSVIFSVTATNVENGTTLYYDITGSVGIASTDFTNSSLSGSLVISGTFDTGFGSTTLTLANDTFTEGTETFNINLRTGSISGTIIGTSSTITILDTSLTPPDIVRDGLVLYLDAGISASYSGSGTTWTDVSGNGKNGTLTNGPTYSSSNGGSIVFDGNNDYASISSPSPLSGTQLFTFEIWVNFTSITGNFGGTNKAAWLFAGGSGSGTGQPEFVVISANNTSFTPNIIIFGRGGGGTTGSLTIDVSSLMSNGNWYQIVLVRSASNVETVYLNGSSIGTGNVSNSFSDGITNFASIENLSSYSGYLNGRISNIKIYNRALTAAEILQNYNVLKGRFGL